MQKESRLEAKNLLTEHSISSEHATSVSPNEPGSGTRARTPRPLSALGRMWPRCVAEPLTEWGSAFEAGPVGLVVMRPVEANDDAPEPTASAAGLPWLERRRLQPLPASQQPAPSRRLISVCPQSSHHPPGQRSMGAVHTNGRGLTGEGCCSINDDGGGRPEQTFAARLSRR